MRTISAFLLTALFLALGFAWWFNIQPAQVWAAVVQ